MKQPNPLTGYKVDKSTLISLEKGKIPPQAIDLEEVVLGAMMIDKKGVDEVIDILSPASKLAKEKDETERRNRSKQNEWLCRLFFLDQPDCGIQNVAI